MTMAGVDEVMRSDQATVHDVDAKTLRAWLESGHAVLVDVREPDEHLRERVAGAKLMPLSRFDPSGVPSGRRVVLHCRSGSRSREAAQRLLAAGRTEAFHLSGGLSAWKDAGLPTIRTRVPISIIRQVQITIGVMVLATVALGAIHSPWWLAATAFMGAGLLFAGATGTCALAGLISLMPWNRAFRSSQACDASGGCSCESPPSTHQP